MIDLSKINYILEQAGLHSFLSRPLNDDWECFSTRKFDLLISVNGSVKIVLQQGPNEKKHFSNNFLANFNELIEKGEEPQGLLEFKEKQEAIDYLKSFDQTFTS